MAIFVRRARQDFDLACPRRRFEPAARQRKGYDGLVDVGRFAWHGVGLDTTIEEMTRDMLTQALAAKTLVDNHAEKHGFSAIYPVADSRYIIAIPGFGRCSLRGKICVPAAVIAVIHRYIKSPAIDDHRLCCKQIRFTFEGHTN